MKVIDIFLIGKYDYKNNIGCWTYYMSCMGAVKKDCNYTTGKTSAARMAIIALLHALECIHTPCIIRIHTKNNFNLNNIKKSQNKDLLEKVQMIIIKAGHQISIDNDVNDDVINTWEYMYGNKAERDAEAKRLREQQKAEKKIQKEMDKQLEKQAEQNTQDWRSMYSDLMGPSEGAWVPGSGGY